MSYERELVKRIGDLDDRHEHEEWLDNAYEMYGEAMQERDIKEQQQIVLSILRNKEIPE